MKKYGDKYDLNIGMTETEMTEKIGFHKIWDCGLIKYVWKQKQNHKKNQNLINK